MLLTGAGLLFKTDYERTRTDKPREVLHTIRLWVITTKTFLLKLHKREIRYQSKVFETRRNW